jgi:hypothetical protein
MRGHVLRRIFSTDHKVIGLQYGFTSLFFLLVGFVLVILMRWQHAYSGQPLPFLGGLLGEVNAPGGVISPEFYNQLGAMHGTIMVFLGVVPLAFGAFGNYVVPLQIGAPDMAFPRLNALSYWLYLAGGLVMLVSFLVTRRRREQRLDLVRTVVGPCSGPWPDALARRHAAADLFVAARRDELHRHNHSTPRAGHDVVPAALLRVGAVHHRVPAAPGVPGLRPTG